MEELKVTDEGIIRMLKIPRQNALVQVKEDYKTFLVTNSFKDSNLLKDDIFIYLGKIPNMIGCCIVVGYTSGIVTCGTPSECFEELL